jgi:hypothetical protein
MLAATSSEFDPEQSLSARAEAPAQGVPYELAMVPGESDLVDCAFDHDEWR